MGITAHSVPVIFAYATEDSDVEDVYRFDSVNNLSSAFSRLVLLLEVSYFLIRRAVTQSPR